MWVLSLALFAAQAPVPWIIDSDCGSDDYMAVSYLLGKKNVRIEAILSVNGLAHAGPGARNMKRLVEFSGQPGIPVFAGAGQAMASDAAFPAEWRKTSDELPGVELPALRGAVEKQSGVEWLTQRLTKPARVLALGPLTNIGLALRKNPGLAANLTELVIMGGAIHVPGNLKDGDYYKTNNRWAEWNLFIDPDAAEVVFRAVKTIKLVPLDATNRVPFRVEHIAAFARHPFMRQILKMDEALIREGVMYAWDPLAAVAVGAPWLLKFEPVAVAIVTKGDQAGRTAPVGHAKPNIRTAVPPVPETFHREFSSIAR